MSLTAPPIVEPAASEAAVRSPSREQEPSSLAALARLVGRAVGQRLSPDAFAPLAVNRAGFGTWRIYLEQSWKGNTTSLVVKIVSNEDSEPFLLRWLTERGRLAPRIYWDLPLHTRSRILVLEDAGSRELPATWPHQPRLADAVVEWISRIARIAVPDPVPSRWTNWSRTETLVSRFETAWVSLQAAELTQPGWLEREDIELLQAVFTRRAIIAQRLRPICRRLIHGNLTPKHVRVAGSDTLHVWTTDWGEGGCGPLAFDLYDLIWDTPDPEFDQVLADLVCLMPSDVRPELTQPVLRLAGVAGAFLRTARAVTEDPQMRRVVDVRTPARQTQLRTALTRLRRWHGHAPPGAHPR